MSRGYQLIEPECLSPIFSDPNHFEFAVMLLYWLIKQLKLELDGQLHGIEIDMVKVTYLGSYPAIGIHYLVETSDDFGPLIETAIDHLLRDRPVIEVVKFISSSNIQWGELERIKKVFACPSAGANPAGSRAILCQERDISRLKSAFSGGK